MIKFICPTENAFVIITRSFFHTLRRIERFFLKQWTNRKYNYYLYFCYFPLISIFSISIFISQKHTQDIDAEKKRKKKIIQKSFPFYFFLNSQYTSIRHWSSLRW